MVKYQSEKMRIALLIIGLSTCACSGNNERLEEAQTGESGTTTYEGRVPLDEFRNLYIEVSLRPSREPGQGFFTLNETMEEQEGNRVVSDLHGKYSIAPDESGEVLIIHLHQSSVMEKIKRTFLNAKDKKLYQENFRNSDLRLRRNENLALLTIANLNSQRISEENEPVLIRRTSKPFTVEGYFTHMGDSARFEEINTEQLWPVSKLGAYHVATRQYHQLADKKYERIYLKGVGYSVVNFNRRGEEGEALVFKKILQMTSAPSVE
jgi:hypothetical protein